jgi:S-disulfanyl-L-cysteine oxidoreductase SoxD
MKRTIILIAACAVLTVVTGLQVVRAQAKSVAEGAYTAEQAKKGAALYKEQCAACHGEDLAGNDIIPGLTGDTFATNWTGKSVGELYEKINLTMPALNPGSLTGEQTAELIAHILSSNKYPAGKTALASEMEPLNAVKIDAPKK